MFVYFVASEECGKFKIGAARNIKKRLYTHRCGSPTSLYLIGFIEVIGWVSKPFEDEPTERLLKQAFRNFHSHRDWFELNDETRAKIEEVVSDYDYIDWELNPRVFPARGPRL